MQADIKTHLLFFLQKYREDLLKEWGKSVIISEIDPYKEEIRNNREEFFDLVIDSFTLPNTDLMKMIRDIAIHIAEERVKADMNMGEFVYNVNLGRTTFFSYLSKVGLDWDNLQESINNINRIFDKFLY